MADNKLETTRQHNGIYKQSRRRKAKFLPYLLVAPLILFIAVLALYPTLLTFVKSFFIVSALDPTQKFAGLANYIAVLTDSGVIQSILNTFLYIIFGVVISLILALFFSFSLRNKFRGRGIILAIVILPWALPPITEGIIWNWIYNSQFGVLNSILNSLHIINHYHVWISGNQLVTIFFIELVQIWQMTPLSVVLILASLQSLPKELFSAAKVDGAGKWKTTWSITLPLIRPGIAIAVVESLIQSINIFDQVYVLNGNATVGSSVMIQTYQIAFENLNFGQGYALSFLTTIGTMIMSVVLLKVINRKVEY